MGPPERQLIFKQSVDAQGWFCNRCQWNVPLPINEAGRINVAADINQRFIAHRCAHFARLQTLDDSQDYSDNRFSQIAALTALLLMLIFPFAVAVSVPPVSLAWLAWSLFSFWAALDAVRLTTLAFPVRHSPKVAIAITVLAGVNILVSLGVALIPRSSM